MTYSTDHAPTDGARAILDAAVELFSERGVDAVSMNDIAKRAGVSKANVFHHFGSKDALYFASLRIACDTTSHLIAATAEADGPVIERLATFLRIHLQSILDNEEASRLVLRELAERGHQRSQALAEQVFGEHFSDLVAIVREGQAQGVLKKTIDPAVLALMLVANNVIFFQTQHVLRHFSHVSFADDPAAYSTQVMEILLNGIKDE